MAHNGTRGTFVIWRHLGHPTPRNHLQDPKVQEWHRDIKHCFLVLSRDFSQYGSCAGSFYQEQKVANIGEFKIVSSEIP